ncbi:MAG: nucleotidyltransferase family protein [Oscillospiraceae bacterium]|nr:nucleotidyltransferase family protein [Oscillospiraceae bacterium]
MKNTAFIISEYDPFHNGHKYHIEQTRQAGAKRIICLMSGNFVQRGDIAFCDKYSRAKFAVDNGADLVLEIPVKNVLSGAGYFAAGATGIITLTGLNATLSFGSSANTKELKELSKKIGSVEFQNNVDIYSRENGTNHALSAYKLLLNSDPQKAQILKDPNNILALEYIKAMSDIDIFSVKRDTLFHDSSETSDKFASAKYIREEIYKTGSIQSVKEFLPENVFISLSEMMSRGEAPSDKNKFSALAMYRLISMDKNEFAEINGINQGLENRIYSAIRESSELYSLYDRVKTKRFTHSRIRQALVSSVLGIKRSDLDRPLPYIRVLGFNGEGREIIKEIRSLSSVPLIMNLSEAPDCKEKELDYRVGKLYDICRPSPLNKNAEFASKPYVSQ